MLFFCFPWLLLLGSTFLTAGLCFCPFSADITLSSTASSRRGHYPSCGSQNFLVPWSGTEILTAAPSSPRFIVRRTRFGDDAPVGKVIKTPFGECHYIGVPKKPSGFSGSPLSPKLRNCQICSSALSVQSTRLSQTAPVDVLMVSVSQGCIV